NGTNQTRAPARYAPAIRAAEEIASRFDSRTNICRPYAYTRSGAVSQTACERMPAASAAQNAATTSARRDRVLRISTCTASTTARPKRSLNGRAAVTQYRGDVTTNSAATRFEKS